MKPAITGASLLAAVAGWPVHHSLSPLIHNAWLAAAGLDGAYVAFSVQPDRFAALVEGFRGGNLRGLNVTLPLKAQALALADRASARAERAGAANLLVFAPDGNVEADNTDGEGLLRAFDRQAPGFTPADGPVVVLGAGGAARGAAAALLEAGAPEVRLINRTRVSAEAVADAVGGPVSVFGWAEAGRAMADAAALINATSLGLEGQEPLVLDTRDLPEAAVVMDMVYRPLRTELLARAEARGHRVVDGLEMLIGQAEPSFKALFGRDPPAIDVRSLALAALGDPG